MGLAGAWIVLVGGLCLASIAAPTRREPSRSGQAVSEDYGRAGELPPELRRRFSEVYEQALARMYIPPVPRELPPRWPAVIDRWLDKFLLAGFLLSVPRALMERRKRRT